jgi:ubiquinone/menaquinone biosynthesis C-methylase UbiE
MNDQERKATLQRTFDVVASGYDNPALRFFPESARNMAALLSLNGKEHVLDVASGTGAVALQLARILPRGHVTAIDFSGNMLAQARQKAERHNMRNVAFMEMDMEELEFPDNHFDAATCAFGLFFAEDMERQLTHIADKIRPGGRIVISGFCEDAFLPLAELFLGRIESYGVQRPSLSWKDLSSEERCISLYQKAGLNDIRVVTRSVGYYLRNAVEWWAVVWNAGFRGLVNQLSPHDLEEFRKEHVDEIDRLSTDEGIWLDVKVLYTIGAKRSE